MNQKKLLPLLIFILVLTGCNAQLKNPFAEKPSNPPVQNNPVAAMPGSIKSFANAEELRQFLAQNNQSQTGSESMMLDAAAGAGRAMIKSAPVAAESVQDGGAANYSKTNNQVAGVDEDDIVKTNGSHVYYARNNRVEVVKSDPASDAQLETSISMPGNVVGLFLHGDKLVAYGSADNFQPGMPEVRDNASVSDGITAPDIVSSKRMGIMPGRWGGDAYSFLAVYDIADPRSPKQLADLKIEGSSFGARLIGQYLYLITTKYQYDSAAAKPIPRLFAGEKELGLDSFPHVYYFDMPYQSYSFTSVNALDLGGATFEPQREIYLLGGNETLYVSEKNIYISYTRYLNEHEMLLKATREAVWPRLAAADRDLINQIEALPATILSDAEKLNKISNIVMKFSAGLSSEEQQRIEVDVKESIRLAHPQLADELVSTSIHRISISGTTLKHEAQGSVPGSLLNQFSLDERDGQLRLATTRPQSWSQFISEEQNKSSNNLFVLDGNMQILGKLTGLAATERIYSARFIGQRAYLVTFRQTDPLFVIDLENAATPKVLGELKVPGYSNYLHPYADNLLIGIGKNTETNQFGGVVPTDLKIALFDATDPENPREIAKAELGGRGSDSAALYDHKAFLFDKQREVLALPATVYSEAGGQFGYGELEFNGAIVFDLSTSSIKERGRISHNKANLISAGTYDWQRAVRRNLLIRDNIVSISDSRISFNQLTDLAELKSLEFPSEPAERISPARLNKNQIEPSFSEAGVPQAAE